MQLLGPNKLIMRWLSPRRRARACDWQLQRPGEPYPVAIALGADPAIGRRHASTRRALEYAFAGLLRVRKQTVSLRDRSVLNNELLVPGHSEIILEGYIDPEEMAEEGPFGDHTGYYNEVEQFPVFTVDTITTRENPIYHSTYTGRPPDEPAILG